MRSSTTITFIAAIAILTSIANAMRASAQNASVFVVSPNGGEQFAAGDTATIEWSGALPRDPVRLSYSVDGGATWSVITDRAMGAQYRWRVPATTTGDARVRAEIWQPENVASMRELPRHNGVVSGGGFNRDGSLLATYVRRVGHPDNADVYVWETNPIRQIRRISITRRDVNAVVWAPDGTSLLIAGTINNSGDTCARIVDAASGLVSRIFRGHSDRVVSAAFSPDGSLLATGSLDLSVRIWRVATGELITQLDSFRASVGALAFSPNGERLVTAGGVSEGIQLWDVATWNSVAVMRIDSFGRSFGNIREISFSSDGQRLLAATETSGGVSWDVESLTVHRLFIQRRGELLRASFSPNGRFVVGGRDTVVVWNAVNGARLVQIPSARYPLTLLAFAPDGAQIIAGGQDSVARIYTMAGAAMAEDQSDRSFGIGMPAGVATRTAPQSRMTVAVVGSGVEVELESLAGANIRLTLVNMRGEIAARVEQRVDAGRTRIILSRDNLAVGTYVVSAMFDGVTFARSIVVRR
ncbi:MAG: WD40 repeat domain-containing protein [bacterium]|nr:WD40 repeat domain-containing protein [Candidatus Kapabacteria bacterium]